MVMNTLYPKPNSVKRHLISYSDPLLPPPLLIYYSVEESNRHHFNPRRIKSPITAFDSSSYRRFKASSSCNIPYPPTMRHIYQYQPHPFVLIRSNSRITSINHQHRRTLSHICHDNHRNSHQLPNILYPMLSITCRS